MNSSSIPHRSSLGGVEAPRPMLLILRRASLLDDLAPTIAATALADTMRAHQLITRRAGDQCRRIQALMLAAVATAVA